MQDEYLIAHFNRRSGFDLKMSDNEHRRIAATLSVIPSEWRSVIDIGCGDGRATEGLLDQQVDLYGIDWSSQRLARFQGKAIAADIRSPWPLNTIFDGAVLAEVLEHLSLAEIRGVFNNIRRFVRNGFVVSVPAYESLSVNFTTCKVCKRDYHLWGHQHHLRFRHLSGYPNYPRSLR